MNKLNNSNKSKLNLTVDYNNISNSNNILNNITLQQPSMRFKPRTNLERIIDSIELNTPLILSRNNLKKQLLQLGLTKENKSNNHGIKRRSSFIDINKCNLTHNRLNNNKEINNNSIDNINNKIFNHSLKKVKIKDIVKNKNKFFIEETKNYINNLKKISDINRVVIDDNKNIKMHFKGVNEFLINKDKFNHVNRKCIATKQIQKYNINKNTNEIKRYNKIKNSISNNNFFEDNHSVNNNTEYSLNNNNNNDNKRIDKIIINKSNNNSNTNNEYIINKLNGINSQFKYNSAYNPFKNVYNKIEELDNHNKINILKELLLNNNILNSYSNDVKAKVSFIPSTKEYEILDKGNINLILVFAIN